MKTMLTAIALAAIAMPVQAQYNLIPQPRHISTTAEGRVTPNNIVRVEGNLDNDTLREAYRVSITPTEIRVEAYSPQGFVWADRTLEQLVDENGTYPQVEIIDRPEFPLRGFMYDTGRNFVEVDVLEHMIDLCSRYKLNTFHWHLTDKPGWRIECRAYPQLNDAKYQRIGRQEGRFYTYADIRHILDYARERGIMIIPEIDMPGHSDYFNATFGFAMNTPEGMAVLTDCLGEFFSEFSAEEMPYIHIGSDEIHINNPEEFMAWAVNMVESNGRTALAWDPGLIGSSSTIYQVWRDNGEEASSLDPDRLFVDSYMGYLNYVDPIMNTPHNLLHTPCVTGTASASRLGGILCLWNDVRVTDPTRLPLHNGMMGGVLPFAERFWLGGMQGSDFADVLSDPDKPQMQMLQEFNDRVAYHKERFLPSELSYWHPNRPSTEWNVTITDSLGNVLHSGKAYGDMIDFNAICTKYGIEGATDAEITRVVHVEADTVYECRIGFDAPARSNRLSDGIALQGKWENFGTVTVNGETVLPPVWDQPGLYKYHYHTWARPEEELPYTDEQLYWMRKPVAVKLKKGDNEIKLTTKRHFSGQRFEAAMLDMP